jgi:hypothetical protein
VSTSELYKGEYAQNYCRHRRGRAAPISNSLINVTSSRFARADRATAGSARDQRKQHPRDVGGAARPRNLRKPVCGMAGGARSHGPRASRLVYEPIAYRHVCKIFQRNVRFFSVSVCSIFQAPRCTADGHRKRIFRTILVSWAVRTRYRNCILVQVLRPHQDLPTRYYTCARTRTY